MAEQTVYTICVADNLFFSWILNGGQRIPVLLYKGVATLVFTKREQLEFIDLLGGILVARIGKTAREYIRAESEANAEHVQRHVRGLQSMAYPDWPAFLVHAAITATEAESLTKKLAKEKKRLT
ncbi:MAG: hypothetical protein ABIH21_02475 [Patescibacteria group bacterium]